MYIIVKYKHSKELSTSDTIVSELVEIIDIFYELDKYLCKIKEIRTFEMCGYSDITRTYNGIHKVIFDINKLRQLDTLPPKLLHEIRNKQIELLMSTS